MLLEPTTRRDFLMDPELQSWIERLEALTNQIRTWVSRDGWRTRRAEKTIRDRRLGPHTVPVLLMEKDTVEVVLNPVSPSVQGTEGAVDLYLAPAYDDIANLCFQGNGWVINYAFGRDPMATHSTIEIKQMPLSEENFMRVLASITAPIHG